MHRRVPLLVATAGLALTGCSSPGDQITRVPQASAASAARSDVPVVIDMRRRVFAPKRVTIVTGQRVIWRNLDPYVHDVTASSGAGFRSRRIHAGGVYFYTAPRPGQILYECTLHPGMAGTLDVVAR